ncbi:MAG: glycosyltransferase, partial [Pseudomonadota bacterium]
MSKDATTIAAIAIGRNEGERLARCLASLKGAVSQIVYVDSGSTDGSIDMAKDIGADVVELDTSRPFTAARARNAGLERLAETGLPPLVQFIDGDCELHPQWIGRASAFLAEHPDIAAICGRRRERFPERTIWNGLIDREWDTPVGEALACGGDALIRIDAFEAVGRFDPTLIAGEEPELCVRLRRAGWKIWRLDAEMTLHDAAMHRFSQWWSRSVRAGYAYAEGAAMHGAPPECHRVSHLLRALIWGLGLPLIIIAGSMISPWAWLVLAVYPLQILRLSTRMGFCRAMWLSIAKFAEAQG